jgi:GT2 family glycosyltransferase
MRVSTATAPTLSIIIVSWNTREILARCLETITSRNFEIILVDNDSADGTVTAVRERFPQVHVVANTENVGFARACNQGIRMSTGRYVLLLNPDTEADPSAIDSLVRFMEEHEEAGAAGPRVLNPDGTLQRSCFREPRLSRELWRLLHLDALYPYAEYPVHRWDDTRLRRVDTVLGACLIVRRAALERVGLLDERFFIYSEEVDLCTRMRSAGWHVYWVPGIEVMHRGAESTRQVAALMFLRLYQAKIQYFRKHKGRIGAHVYKFILAIAATLRLMMSPAAWLERADARARHLALAGAYARLLLSLPRF